jgi:hypothetical protein
MFGNVFGMIVPLLSMYPKGRLYNAASLEVYITRRWQFVSGQNINYTKTYENGMLELPSRLCSCASYRLCQGYRNLC